MPQLGLPQAVVATRSQIVAAATACDFEALADLGGAGASGLTFSFGGADDPAAFWRAQEARGDQPLRHLVELLNRPFATRELPGTTQYLWPSAYAFESWEAVPEADREALKPLYGEEDLADFASFGGYIGYRVGITAAGDWAFFVAGD
ncbi:MAG: hypothetical protein ACRDZ9_01060 [Acidimicrobiales bacterium]